MKNRKLNQLGVAVKIWLVAVVINALLGTLSMSIQNSWSAALGLLVFLTIFGGIFSLPVLMMITIVIWQWSSNVPGKWLFWMVLTVGVSTTIVMFLLIWEDLGGGDKKAMFLIPGMGIVSGIIGVVTFYRSVFKCSEYKPALKA